MKLSRRRRRMQIGDLIFEATRTDHGVVELWADDDDALACALGAAHATDRLVQMETARILGQGRLAECLLDDDRTVAIDRLMRNLGFAHAAEREIGELDPATRRWVEAYSSGVNDVLKHRRRPFELVLVRHRPAPWTAADTLLTVKLISYFGLAQSQQDAEKFIVQVIHDGGPVDALKRLFRPHLDGLEPEVVDAVRRLAHLDPLLPGELRFSPVVPKVSASNNWALAGSRTATGTPIQCNDPHLEINRLPALWAEAVLHTPADDRVGVTMPGVPGLVMGRTRQLSFGFTYGFMDLVDFFVEELVGGRCRRSDGFAGLTTRVETIERKNHPAETVAIHATDIGVLETDPSTVKLADGLYLARAWSGHDGGAAASLGALRRLARAGTVRAAQEIARDVAISANWLFADRDGSIGYQQSGRLPDRRHSGLHPVAAWNSEHHWRGVVSPRRLHSERDPADGILVTANNDINPPGGPLAVNLPMGPYRHDRIRALLEAGTGHTVDDMRRIQLDLTSIQAGLFLEQWRPLLPDTLAGRLLTRWNCRYDVASRGATLFEEVYHALLRRVIGERMVGGEAWDALVDETCIVADYFHLFDRVLLGEDPFWWGEAGKAAVLRQILDDHLTHLDPYRVMPWGRRHATTLTNIFFDGRLPRWLGFDVGPVELPGGRATVVQGGLFTAHGRLTTFAPSWRFITDLGADVVDTVLAGGPSGRRFSRWYTTDVERWLKGEYKRIRFRS